MQDQSYRATDCFDELVDRFGDLVYRIAYARVQTRADADDVFQEVFLLWRIQLLRLMTRPNSR